MTLTEKKEALINMCLNGEITLTNEEHTGWMHWDGYYFKKRKEPTGRPSLSPQGFENIFGITISPGATP